MNNSSLIIISSNNKRDKNMFTEIQQYIKDKDYPVNNSDSTCLEIMADFKDNIPEAYEEISYEIYYQMEENRIKNSDWITSIIEDAIDGHHDTLTNLITHHTNDYIKTVNAEIEDIEDEAIEVSLTAMRDKQQNIDCDNSERLRSI